ncbi:MAG: globin domain-containing protein [Pseudomonadota bacterium]
MARCSRKRRRPKRCSAKICRNKGCASSPLSTLRLIAEALDAPETLSDHMTRLAEGHRAYGVRPEHYAPMGRALRRALKQALGERYDGETDAAWDRAYQAMSQKMQAV